MRDPGQVKTEYFAKCFSLDPRFNNHNIMKPRCDSRKRFCPWLEQTINEGSCPGLEWLDKDQGIFKVPWYHYNRSEPVAANFKVFRDWALHTGIHVSGKDEDYPKWKRNFRCALNKVPDIAEVAELHSGKSATVPYKVYKFLNWNRSTPPVPESRGVSVLVDREGLFGDNSVVFYSSLVPIGTFSGTLSTTGQEDEGHGISTSFLAPQIGNRMPRPISLVSGDNVPPVVMETPPLSTELVGNSEDLDQKQQQQQHHKQQQQHQEQLQQQQQHNQQQQLQQQQQQHIQQQQQQKQKQEQQHQQHYYEQQRKQKQQLRQQQQQQQLHQLHQLHHIGDQKPINRGQPHSLPCFLRPGASLAEVTRREENQCLSLCPGASNSPFNIDTQENAPISLSDTFVLELANKEMPLMKEDMDVEVLENKSIPDNASSGRGAMIPLDLSSVISDDLVTLTSENLPCPPPISTQGESTKDTSSQIHIMLPETDATALEGLVVKVFYGPYQRHVLEHTILNSGRGCRVYYSRERKRDIPDFEERMYGPPDALQLELPKADTCNIGPKLRDFMDAILREMHRGVVLTTHDGDIYARRLCRTRAFVYDQNKCSWALSRKTNIPEKIFDFGNFCRRFEKYKERARNSDCTLPEPYVYLTFGHGVPLKDSIQGKVLVAIAVVHRRAEQMLNKFQSGLGLDLTCVSRGPFFSSMNTMDRLIEVYDTMSLGS